MMPAAATDRQLLSRFVRLGDQSAFSTLVARHLGLVRSVALRRSGGDPALADEIAQTVFAILARKASKMKPGASLAGWLWQTAYFEAAKAQRKEALHRRRIETFRTETSGAGIIPPEENLEWEKVRPALDQALTELSPADREIIFLRYYQNQSYRAIGLQLGKSEGACQKQASRALQKLGRLMRGHGVLLSGAAVPLDRLLSLQQMQVAASSHGAGAVAVSQAALASSASLGPFQVLSHTLQTMAYGKTKTAAAIALLAAIPIGMQWADNQELRRRLTQNGPVLSQVSVLPGSSAIPADDVAAGNAVARRPHPSLIEPGPDKRMTVAAWEQALLQPDPLERARLLSALLEALDASSAPAVAQAFQRVAHSGGEFEEDFRLFLRAWGGLDGQAALDHLSESGRELGNNPETLAALSGWAASDPGAAQSWVQAFEDGDTREHLVYGLLDGWSLVDFSAAAAFAESRPRSEARSRFIELLFQRSIAQNGFSAAQDWVSSIAGDERNETYKRQAFDRVVRAMVYRDPSLAAHWISQNVGESFAAGDAVAMVAEKMSETSPSSALKWMESLAGLPGSAAASGYRAALTALTAQNPDAAGAWLSKNADLPAYDELAARFAQAIAGLDPQSAVAWAKTVGNGAGRDEALAAVARRHLQEGGEYAEADLLEAGVPQATIDAAGLDRLVEERLASERLASIALMDSLHRAEEFIGKVQDGADAASVELELVFPADPHQLGGPSMPSGHVAVSPQMQCVDCHGR